MFFQLVNFGKSNLYTQYLEVIPYLFSLTIFIINIGQDKINPAQSITEEHWVFTVLLFVNL